MKRLKNLFMLFILCVKEIILSNYKMMCLCFSSSLKHQPGYLAIKTNHDLSDTQMVMLAHLITITPGTMTVGIQNNKVLYVHMLDYRQEERSKLKQLVEKMETYLISLTGVK